MPKLRKLSAHEILASGGLPTLEVTAELDTGEIGIASVPYGASAGSHEATVLVDQDPNRWQGMGMLKAASNVETEIASKLMGQDVENPRFVDETLIALDGTSNKARLGGNAILATSLAIARAMAKQKKVPLYQYIIDSYGLQTDVSKLPHPMIVAIEGGKHADETTDLQEFCLLGMQPSSPTQAIRQTLETYQELKKVLKDARLSTNVGNEGAFAPSNIGSNEAPLKYILQAIEAAGYTPGVDIGISIDAAATEFFHDGKYELAVEGRSYTSLELIEYFRYWLNNYPIASMEDMLSEDDWEYWPVMKKLADDHHIPLIGDDLTVTNTARLQKAIDAHAISAILIKLNQIGTLTETIDCCQLATTHGLMTTTSHRGGGETNDTAMVDVAVAVGSAYIKVGPTRGERVSKYNRLMEIERQLNERHKA